MFTGIIEAVGEIASLAPRAEGLCLGISPGALDVADIKIGDSVAVNGVCLTLTSLENGMLSVEVSGETLRCTEGLDKQGQRVNLEKAMRFSDRLGGHLVSGHVDSIGEVVACKAAGDSRVLGIRAPVSLLKYIAPKGSITMNGVSLTVNCVVGDTFFVNIIPHTLARTALNDLEAGVNVNLEIDMIARYIEQLLMDRTCSKLP